MCHRHHQQHQQPAPAQAPALALSVSLEQRLQASGAPELSPTGEWVFVVSVGEIGSKPGARARAQGACVAHCVPWSQIPGAVTRLVHEYADTAANTSGRVLI